MKKILIICPFDNIYPPTNGGLQRFFNIIHQVAKRSDVTVISHQKTDEFLRANEEFPAVANIRVLSTLAITESRDVFSFFPPRLRYALRYRWYQKRIRGSADSDFLAYYPILKRCLKRERFDCIILESPSTLNAVSLIRRYDKHIKIIFDAHNVDSNLAKSYLEKGRISSRKYRRVLRSEQQLHRKVDAAIVCSVIDKKEFERLNDNLLSIAVIPNGVTVYPRVVDDGVRMDKPDFILFCAYLGTPANREALAWFHKSIWPKVRRCFPSLQLLVAGSGSLPEEMNGLLTDKGLVFTGRVNDIKPFYARSTLSIVPLKTGSGTRLKILESMSLGVPVVSTSKGAEGIDYTDGENVMIADDEHDFAQKVLQLLSSKEQRLQLQQNARMLVETKYDWNLIGDQLMKFIDEVCTED